MQISKKKKGKERKDFVNNSDVVEDVNEFRLQLHSLELKDPIAFEWRSNILSENDKIVTPLKKKTNIKQ